MKSIRLLVRFFVLPIALTATLLSFPIHSPVRMVVQMQGDSRGPDYVKIRAEDGTKIELYKRSYALIIGESNYKYWKKLIGVKRDVEEVKAILGKHGFEVTVVMDPSRVEFDSALREFKSKHDLSNPSRFLFYFAGHGHTMKTDDGRELGYIVPSDAQVPSKDAGAFKGMAISMNEILTFARDISSRHALFVFDSCFSGSLFDTRRSTPEGITARIADPVRLFITAGTEKQEVPDDSIFCAEFVNALKGEGDLNHDGYVTGSELGEFLIDKVTKYSNNAQTPHYGKIRDSKLDKGDLVFVVPIAPPQSTLPFDLETKYIPSGFMGDIVEVGGTGHIAVSTQPATLEGKPIVATRLEYRQGSKKGWAGIYWLFPENNWGDEVGMSLAGAKRISFYAKGERGGEIVEFISGGVSDKNKPNKDRFKKSLGKMLLSSSWTKYVIDLSDLSKEQLSSVIGAFAWVAVGGYDKDGRLITYIANLRVE